MNNWEQVRLQFRPYHWLAVWPWASSFTSLSLGLLWCEVQIEELPCGVLIRINISKAYKVWCSYEPSKTICYNYGCFQNIICNCPDVGWRISFGASAECIHQKHVVEINLWTWKWLKIYCLLTYFIMMGIQCILRKIQATNKVKVSCRWSCSSKFHAILMKKAG